MAQPGFDSFEDQRSVYANIHPMALVEVPVKLGDATLVQPYARIMPYSIIGQHCVIGHHVTLYSGVMVGDYVKVMDYASVQSGVILENHVTCSAGSLFTRLAPLRDNKLTELTPTLVREGAFIGPQCTIATGVIVGKHALIQAGSVIHRNIPDFAMAGGSPCEIQGWHCKCGQILSLDPVYSDTGVLTCSHCGTQYQMTPGPTLFDTVLEYLPMKSI
jgi:UDP-2-acetamido-3-amino-2,3-dideoxy-glucuronate N-acetyltransferase